MDEYRSAIGKPPVTPWARSRTCTAYMKNRVMGAYIRSLGIERYDLFIGLRSDEPTRVARLVSKNTRNRRFRCPLSESGIAKPDVLEFWRGQSFNLSILERQGNCTGCFLKDQTDLSRVLGEQETDAAWWIRMEDEHAMFGGKSRVPYRQLLAERDDRLAIEAALRDRRVPSNTGRSMDAHRFNLVVIQEKKRLDGKIPPFSCSCEATQDLADDADELDEEEEENAPRYGQLPLFAR